MKIPKPKSTENQTENIQEKILWQSEKAEAGSLGSSPSEKAQRGE